MSKYGKSNKPLGVGGIAAGVMLAAIIFGIIISVVIAGAGVLVITHPELFQGGSGAGNKGNGNAVVGGTYFDEYAKKIQTLDLNKLRQDNPSKETDPGMYTGTRNIAEEFEVYLLLAEICQRPEINPTYGGGKAENPGDSWVITPGMLYGIWYHESGMSLRGYQEDGDAARAYNMWDPTGNSSFGGPCGQALEMDNRMIASAYRMHMYISRFEAPDMPDELRAICGSESEIKQGKGTLYDGTKVSWEQISQYVRFNSDIRPSPRFVADALYSEARAIRQIMSGENAFSAGSLPNMYFAADAEIISQWIERLGVSGDTASALGFLWAASPLSERAALTNPPEFTSGDSNLDSDKTGGLYRIYLQMAASGVPLDFWAVKDPNWCPSSKIGDSVRDMSTVMENINQVLFGGSVRNGNAGVNFTSGDGIINKLDTKGGLIFPELGKGLTEAFQIKYASNETVARQSPFPIESLNGGNWIQSSVWKMIDVYYGDEKYTLPKEEQGDTWDVVPGEISSDPEGGPYTEYLPTMPRITYPNGVGQKSGKWFITPGALSSPITGATIVGYDYHDTSCGHGHDHVKYGHPGLDLGGGSEIKAVADGVVIRTRYYTTESTAAGGFGTYVVVLHCVNGNYFCSVYAHMQPQSFNLHKPGDNVSKGETLGYVGQTGNAYGAHCHFQLNYNLENSGQGSWGYSLAYTWDPRWSIPSLS